MPDSRGSIYDEWRQAGSADLYNLFADCRCPVNDAEVWDWYPEYRPFLNKLHVAGLQGLRCAPHGIDPPPGLRVFSRPIYNLEGLSVGAEDVLPGGPMTYRAGYCWVEYLPGPQYNLDLLYVNGRIVFKAAMRPEFNDQGSVVRWESLPASIIPEEVAAVDRFAWEHFGQNYSGCLTAEVRDRRIVEVMPRMSSQFVDFYADGDEYVDAVLGIYRENRFPGELPEAPGGVSEVLRVPRDGAWDQKRLTPNLFRVRKLEQQHNIRVYIPVPVGWRLGDLPDDPWSFRVAYINSRNPVSREVRQRVMDEVLR